MNPYEMVGKTITVDGVPAIPQLSGSGEQDLINLSGTFKVTDFDELAEQFYLISEEDEQMLNYLRNDEEPRPFYMYYVDMGYIDPTPEMVQEVDSLEEQFNMPAAEHPLGPHTGYKLDSDLDDVLREQMIEGGVPEDEVQPSINDIEEAMDKRIDKKADFTDEDYANVRPEINQQVSKLIKEMRAAGTPMPEIMRHAREIIEASIAGAEQHTAAIEGGNWYHSPSSQSNFCEECVQAGRAPEDTQETGPAAENVQIDCAGCGNQEGKLNREFGRNLIEKMPQNPVIPGVGAIPIPLDTVRQTPGGGPKEYDRRRDWHGSSTDRLNIPDEHLGFYAPEKTSADLLNTPTPTQGLNEEAPNPTLTPDEVAAIEVAVKQAMADQSPTSVMQNPQVASLLQSAVGKLRYLAS